MVNEYEMSTDEYLHNLAWYEYQKEHGYLTFFSPHAQYEFDDGWDSARRGAIRIGFENADWLAGFNAYHSSNGTEED